MCESVLNAIMEGNPHVAVTITAKDLSQVVDRLYDRIEAAKEREAERAREIPTMSRDEVANTLNVSYSTLWRWQNEGILNPVKIGAKSLYRRSDIDAMLQKGAVAK